MFLKHGLFLLTPSRSGSEFTHVLRTVLRTVMDCPRLAVQCWLWAILADSWDRPTTDFNGGTPVEDEHFEPESFHPERKRKKSSESSQQLQVPAVNLWVYLSVFFIYLTAFCISKSLESNTTWKIMILFMVSKKNGNNHPTCTQLVS